MPNPTDLISQAEVAERYGISRQTLWNWRRNGKLKAYNQPGSGPALFFDRDELASLLEPTPKDAA